MADNYGMIRVSIQNTLRTTVMEINGFTFSSRLMGTSACYHVAKRGDVVFTSKEMSYLIRKVKNYGTSTVAIKTK
jgi:hypothetical protein